MTIESPRYKRPPSKVGTKVVCPVCIKRAGLEKHIKDSHGSKEVDNA